MQVNLLNHPYASIFKYLLKSKIAQRTPCEFSRVDVLLASAAADDFARLHDGARLHLNADCGGVCDGAAAAAVRDDKLDYVSRVGAAVDVAPALLHAELQRDFKLVNHCLWSRGL